MTEHDLTAPLVSKADIRAALAKGGVIDITTRGRKSGEARRIEIVFHDFDGRRYITGMPGKRAWYANLLADPSFIFHLKAGPMADLPARATPITDPAERRPILEKVVVVWNQQSRLERFVSDSPLVEVTFDDGDLVSAP